MSSRANLSLALMMLENYHGAFDNLHNALKIAVRLNRHSSILYQLESFTRLAFLTGQYRITARLYGFITRRSQESNISFSRGTQDKMIDYSSRVHATMDENLYEELVTLGHHLSQDEAVALALSLKHSLNLPPA